MSVASKDKTIILSTHIVEDVEDLCTDMAIMNHGRIIIRGVPSDIVKAIKGNVWQIETDNDQAERLARLHNVLSSRAIKGNVRVHIFANTSPGKSFKYVTPDLHDAYFANLYGYVGAE